MNSLFGRSRFYSPWVFRLVALALCLGLASCSIPPSQADNQKSTDSDLEAKVLQIIRKHPEVIVESVQAYQQKQAEQQQQAQKAFLEQMKTNPKSVIGDSPATGASDQKIVLLEFSDFQCPYCAKAHTTLKQFMATHQNQVTLVYKFLPLTQIHPEAMSSAKAAWAANKQGKFWQFHDALFENQNKLGEPLYIATAKALNLDLKRFDQDRNSEAATAAIQKDMDMAEQIGVTGTPFLVMNGEFIAGGVQIPNLEATLKQVSKP
ncbi:MAG TPA: thioredoxin domain-containing protein [Waterburya sp.]